MITKGMKGGYMEKNKKRFLVFGVLAMFMFMFAVQFVMAAEGDKFIEKEGGDHEKIENPEWLLSTMQFFNLGETWADMIVAVAILLMVFAATFDIMGFTAFENDWVKYLIAGSIAAVTAVMGWVNTWAGWMMGLAGGSVALATTISIIVAAFFFIVGSFWKSNTKAWKAKNVATESIGGFTKSAAGIKGMVQQTEAAAAAA